MKNDFYKKARLSIPTLVAGRLFLIFSFFYCCLLQPVYAQETLLPIVTPVSPSAAAIFKTLDRPIGTYTGTVPVNFPLFKITSGTIETSISLDYNSTGGIRVEEMAANVGLGFNLTAGGRITRVQKGGISDEDPNKGYINGSFSVNQFDKSNVQHLLASWEKTIDLEPDIFMYSFNGESGKFFFNEAGKVIMMQQTNIKVEYFTDGVGIKSWLLYDGNGNKYYFTKQEFSSFSYQTYGSGETPMANGYRSSWLLTEIKDINNQNSITFSYQPSSTAFFTFSGGNSNIDGINDLDCDPDVFYEPRVLVYTQILEHTLAEIRGNSGYVKFDSSNDRLDVEGGTKLRNLALYDHNNLRRKSYHFNYDYFGNSSPISYPLSVRYYRLKLKSFSEFGENDLDSLNYSFGYNEEVNLPERLSHAVDFWGYYNGQINNSTYLPNVTSNYYGQTVRLSSYANRHVYPFFAPANILRKITYPTGGTREFIHECNTVLMTTDDQIKPDPDFFVNQEITRTDFYYGSAQGPRLKQNFTINSTDGGTSFSYILERTNNCSNYSVRLYRVTSPNDEIGGALLYTDDNEQSFTRSLNNGFYRIEIHASTSCRFSNLQLNWDESTFINDGINTPYGTFSKNNREAGGVRIKEIIDYDPISAKSNSTKYLYKLYSIDSTLTSGVLNTPVRVMNEYNTDCSNCHLMILYTSSCYPLANDGGSFVVYPEVRTIEEGNGWIDRTYTHSPDVLDTEYEYPIRPVSTEPAKIRGKLLSEKIYNKIGNLLKENTFIYEPIFEPDLIYSARGLIVQFFFSRIPKLCAARGETSNSPPSRCRSKYYDLSGWIYGLAGKSEKVYSSDGNHVDTKTVYSFDTESIGRPIIVQSTTTLGENKTKETFYRYSFNNVSDFKFGLTSNEQIIKSTLLDSNYLQPLEISNTLTKPGSLPLMLGGLKYSFNQFNGTELHIGNVKEYTSNIDYKETIFSTYRNGRLLEKFTLDGPKEVYLWGYSDMYPVAKILGSDYNTLSAWVTPSVLNDPISDSQLQTHLNAIRINLIGKPAQVETYSYKTSVGMTSTTDAKGMTTFYEYDNFQRLKYIKDHDGNIINSYDYNYKR